MKIFTRLFVTTLLLFSAEANASDGIMASIRTWQPIQAGKNIDATLTLTHDDGEPLTAKELKVVHTKPVHLLITDPSLSDYQHVHPKLVSQGNWHFNFTPTKNSAYHVWVDITPAKGEHLYIKVDIGQNKTTPEAVNTTLSDSASVEGYDFKLMLDSPLKAGDAAMGHITVSKDGQPFKKLEPVMGAFAHIVGFSENGNSVLHVHPMGKEPTRKSQRGGPQLDFHIAPEKAGFIKLYAQVQIAGKNIFVPFGVNAQ